MNPEPITADIDRINGAASSTFIYPPEIRSNYTCGKDGCSVTGEPEAMFNIACNPRETSEDELLKLVRCRSCAAEYAKRVDRKPGQERSGVFPLAMTLKTRQETGVIIPIMFHCSARGCKNSGEPRRMFNLACSEPASSYGVEALLRRIRCRACAAKIARKNGRVLGEHGSGIYPLAHTLSHVPWYEPCSPICRERLHHIIWDRQRRREDL